MAAIDLAAGAGVSPASLETLRTRAEHGLDTVFNVARLGAPSTVADPVPATPARRRGQRPIGGLVGSTALWVYALAALIPLGLMAANSFRTTSSLFSDPLGAPWPLNLDSYRRAWTSSTASRRLTCTWGAARPTPWYSAMVSIMSSISR
jgi:hypothetical protein